MNTFFNLLTLSFIGIFFSGCATAPDPAIAELARRKENRIAGGNLYVMGENEFKLAVGLGFANTPKTILLSAEVVAGFYCDENFKKGYKIISKMEDYRKVLIDKKWEEVGQTTFFFECLGLPSQKYHLYVVRIQDPVKLKSDEETPHYKQASIYLLPIP